MNKLEKTIKYGIYLAFILPLVFTSRTMQPWHFGKTVLFQILVEILLVLALIYFGLSKDPTQKQASSGAGKKIIKLNLLDCLILLFLGLQFISAIFGVNFNRSFWGDQQRAQGIFTWLHFGIFYLLLRQFFIAKKDWENLGIWILIISFISSLLAWFGKYFSFLNGVIVPGQRLAGMIGNPLFLAAYLIIPVFLGIALFFFLAKGDKRRWLILAIGLVNFIVLLFTYIRGAFIGLALGIFVCWLAYLIFGKVGQGKKAIFISGLLFLILFSGAYTLNLKNQNFNNYLTKNFPIAANILNIKPTARTADTRLMAWQAALAGWRDKPIFGWGIENFQDAFDKNYNPQFLKYSMSETVWDRPHNYSLEVLSTYGLIGFAGYLALIATLLFYLIKTIIRQGDGRKKIAFIVLLGAVAAYLGQGSFGIETSNSLQIWFWLLALVSFDYGYEKNENNFYNKNSLCKATGWLALVFIIITPFLIYKNYSFYRASVLMGDTKDAAEIESLYLWKKNAPKVLAAQVPFLWEQAIFITQDLAKFDGKGILDRQTLESVALPLAQIFDANIAKNSNSFLLRFWGGQLYGFMGEYMDNKYYAQSNKLLTEAWNINKERQTAAIILAKNYLLQGRNKDGIAILEEVAAKNEDCEEPHWFLGLALMQDGQKDRGLEELEKGENFGIGFNQGNILFLINLYAERKEYEKIISLYEILINRESNNPQFYTSLAVAYAALGNEEKVIECINKAVELQPELASEAEKFLKEKGIDVEKYK